MKLTVYKKISAAVMALIFYCSSPLSASLLFTDTIYTIPEEKIELDMSADIIHVDSPFQREHISIGFGLLYSFSIWLEMEYIHSGLMTFRANNLGDSQLRLWYYLGDYLRDRLHLGIQLRFLLPTGPDIHEGESWKNIALGQNELKIGLVMQADLPGKIFLHFNGGFTFRQGKNRAFYGGFAVNPLDEKTYTSILGLNPFSDGAFFYYENLKNDYFSFSLAINTNLLYPFIPSLEIYGSFRPYRGRIDESDYPIEGGSIDPFLISMEIRYFFSNELFLSIYGAVNPLWQEGYLKAIYGLSFSSLF